MAEIKINIGDIKKFKAGKSNEHEYSGVVIGKDNYTIIIMDMLGGTTHLQLQGINEVTAVRLAPEVRERLEKIGEIVKNKEKITLEEEKLRKQKRELDNKLDKQREYYMNSIGVMNKYTFERELSKALSGMHGQSIMDAYRISVYGSMSGIQITVQKDVDIVKYPRVEEYSFLYREYDGAIMIYYDAKSYKQLIEKYKNKGGEFKLRNKKVKGFEMNEIRELSMGDKYLYYIHTIDIVTKYNKLDKKLLKEVLKIFA